MKEYDDPTARERLMNARHRADRFLHDMPNRVIHAFTNLLHAIIDQAEEEQGPGDSEQRDRVRHNAPSPEGPPNRPPKGTSERPESPPKRPPQGNE